MPKTLDCTVCGTRDTLGKMQLSDIFLALGEPAFQQLIRAVSIGKLKTYQLYERVKMRFHMNKLNTESLRKVAPRLWARIAERDEEFATDVAQTILVSHLEMIKDVLNLLEHPARGRLLREGSRRVGQADRRVAGAGPRSVQNEIS